MKTKRCSKCKQFKDPQMFSTDNSTPDKLYALCKPCVHTYQVGYIAREKPQPSSSSRVCTQCDKEKDLSGFYQDKSRSDGYCKVCKVCRCAKRQEYVLAHHEKVAADKLAWKRTIKGKAADRRSYEKNREAINARKRQRYADDPDKILSILHSWRIKNPEKAKAIADRGNAQRALYLSNAPINDFTKADWRLILAAFEYRCAYCGEGSNRLERDHVVPVSKGGSHTASNIVPCCRRCNSKKGNKLLV